MGAGEQSEAKGCVEPNRLTTFFYSDFAVLGMSFEGGFERQARGLSFGGGSARVFQQNALEPPW